MSWYEEAAEPVAVLAPLPTPGWTLYLVLGLSAAGLAVAAILRSFPASTAAYSTLLAVGCAALFYHRRRAITATRRAGGSGYLAIGGLERAAIIALTAGCLANGLVIAFEIASWDWAV